MKDYVGEIKQKISIYDVVSRDIDMKKVGSQYQAYSPFVSENSPSFYVSPEKGIFKDFSSGKGGDQINWLEEYHGMSKSEAINYLKKEINTIPEGNNLSYAGKTDKQNSEVVYPVPADKESRPETKDNQTCYEYRDAEGRLICYVLRTDTKQGKKLFPVTWNGESWQYKGSVYPRPLYGLEQLKENKSGSVLIVEGEKAADAGRKLFPHNIVLTWMGGTSVAKNVDLSPISGRKVCFLPDNDKNGYAAMETLRDMAAKKGCETFICEPPEGVKQKWDVADGFPDGVSPDEWLRAGNKKWDPQPPPEPAPKKSDNKPQNKLSFRPLGYSKSEGTNEYYLYSDLAKQVIVLKPSNLNKRFFYQLAPVNELQDYFGDGDKIDEQAVANYITTECYRRGVFDEEKIRGIGAWMDEGRTVIHSGDHLIVDGQRMGLHEINSKYIYEAGQAFGIEVREAMRPDESRKLLDTLKLANWQKDVHASLLAGWIVIAPVCGALPWRPHIWLTGASQTGKSTIFSLTKRMIGKIALYRQGQTTEAGVRQLLGADARPFLFDEADSDGYTDEARLQSILTLARSSSSNDSADVTKGSQGGKAQTFKVKSCFAFASIAPNISGSADQSRITILSLTRAANFEEGKERWYEMKKKISELDDDYIDRLVSRTISMLPVILANTEIFQNAASTVIGEQRAGDQLGPMLAGAYSLVSDQKVTFDEATKWLKQMDLGYMYQVESDENQLINKLLQQTELVDKEGSQRMTLTIGEIIWYASQTNEPDDAVVLSAKMANEWLKRMGIKVQGERVYFANNSEWIHKVVRGTAFASGWRRVMERIEGAQTEDATRFGPLKSRAISMPLENIIKD